MSINKAVENILLDVKTGCVFDSHLVTKKLKRDYPVEYEEYISKFEKSEDPTLRGHQRIGHEILKFRDLAERMDYQSWSENINGNVSECALWKRI